MCVPQTFQFHCSVFFSMSFHILYKNCNFVSHTRTNMNDDEILPTSFLCFLSALFCVSFTGLFILVGVILFPVFINVQNTLFTQVLCSIVKVLHVQ